jgi:hypothetical protein
MINVNAIPIIMKAFNDYTWLVRKVMRLSEKDFINHGKDGRKDYMYGFRMPKYCTKYEDGSGVNCMWACRKMINHFGIADASMFNDDQNYNLTDVAEFDDSFATPLIEVEDDDDELPDDEGEDDRRARRRVLQSSAFYPDASVLFLDTGFKADADEFEYGLVVDDPAFSAAIEIPGENAGNSQSPTFLGMHWGGWAVVALITVALAFGTYFFFKSRAAKESADNFEPFAGKSSMDKSRSVSMQESKHMTYQNSSELMQKHIVENTGQKTTQKFF